MTSHPDIIGHFDALLFDMDGTLLSSVASAERVWTRWAQRHGLDVATFLPTIHGVRAIETIRAQALPGIDPVDEAAALTLEEIADVDGIAAIAGAAAFVATLPPERWAIVTSAPRALARARLAAAGFAAPAVLVTAEDVERGKPAPDCFRLGARRLGFDPARCAVFEDAAAGIAAAEAAGATPIVVTATHAHPIATPHRRISDYTELAATADAAGITLRSTPRS